MTAVPGVLDGRVAIVTGAGRGIGRGIAEALAEAGATLAVIDRDADSVEETASLLVATGATAAAFGCDVSDREQVFDTVAAVVDQFGSLSILVNNAQALRAQVSFMDHTPDDFALALNSGLWGTFHCMQAAFPHLCVAGGAVINLGSSAGTHGLPGLSGYAAAKEGIRGLTKVTAIEWGEHGITVNAICPSAASPNMLRMGRAEPGAVPGGARSTPDSPRRRRLPRHRAGRGVPRQPRRVVHHR